MDDIADEFVNFLYAFFDEYQEMKDKDFFMTGESYAGKYIPAMSRAILDYNEKDPRRMTTKINLKASMIGDPYSYPVKERTEMHNVGYSLGILEDQHMSQVGWLEQQCDIAFSQNSSDQGQICENIMDYIVAVSGGVDQYDSRYFSYDVDPKLNLPDRFFNEAERKLEFYNAINIGWIPKDPKFASGDNSGGVGDALANDQLLSYTDYFRQLRERKHPVLVYYGEFDMKDGPRQQQEQAKAFGLPDDFFKQSRKIYYLVREEDEVGGYFR